jgi:dynein heavy chain
LLESLLACSSENTLSKGVSLEDTLNNLLDAILLGFPPQFDL